MSTLPTGSPLFAGIIGLTVLWGIITLAWAASAIARWRAPAPLWWLLPALLLAAGGGATLLGYAELDRTLAALDGDAKLELLGRSEQAAALSMAMWLTVLGLTISAPLLAVSNVARAGEFGKWKPWHAVPAAIGLVTALGGWISGAVAFGVGIVGTFAIAIAAVRLGAGDDRRRMVAGRAFVGAVATLAAVALALAHLVENRIAVLDAWASAPWTERPAQLAELDASLPMMLGGDGLVALGIAFASLATLVPVARAVLDGRTSGGFLFSAFLSVLPAAFVAPAIVPLFTFEPLDERGDRRTAQRAAGLQLVEAPASELWSPGTPVTVGVYWATVSDKRVLPFKEGRVDDADLDDDYAMPIADAIRAVRYDPVRLEVDRRANFNRLAPVVNALDAEGIEETCFVVRSHTGTLGCLRVRLGEFPEPASHILLRGDDATLIQGVESVSPIELAKESSRLRAIEGPLVLHTDQSVSAQRLLESLAHVNASHPPPWLTF